MLRLLTRALLLFVASTSLAAADIVELRSLLKQKNYDGAIIAGKRLLRSEPDDPETMFLTAYAMQTQQQTETAARLYRQLIAQHPELPEPRNNLAMILLQQEKYDEAARLLVEALNTHPSYATSYRNLNLIYKGIASEAYRRAVSEADNGESFASSIQLDAISQLQPIDSPAQLAAVSQPPAPTATTAVAEAAANAVTETVDTAPVENRLATTTIEPATGTVAAVSVEQAPTAADSTTAEPATAEVVEQKSSDNALLEQQLLGWAEAWSSKAFNRYIDFYHSDYRSRFASRAEWVEQRRQRIARPGDITVEISEIKIRARSQDRVVLDFEQRYESSNYRDRVVKRLVMRRFDNQWKITSERVLSVL